MNDSDKNDTRPASPLEHLVRRLREMARYEHDDLSIGDEAADEIERLRAELAMLRTGDTCARVCEGTAYRIESSRFRAALEEIANANSFDNIGRWARNRARQAL